MRQTAKRFSAIGALVVPTLLAAGCGGSESDCGTPAAFDIAGSFNERYNCDEAGECKEEDVEFLLIISEGVEQDSGSTWHEFHNPALGWHGEGILCDKTFEWTATATGLTESGTWIFTDADNFTKWSTYEFEGNTGTCRGAATRVDTGDPPAPPPIGACP